MMAAMHHELITVIAASVCDFRSAHQDSSTILEELKRQAIQSENAAYARDAQLQHILNALEARGREDGDSQVPAKTSFSKMGGCNPT
jgi:hypothetical protein